MPRPNSTELPQALLAFAEKTEGGFEDRFASVVEHAFMTHALFLTSPQLRKACGGGHHRIAQRVIDSFRESVHKRVSRRLSASALADWIDAGMEPAMTDLSSRERLIGSLFLREIERVKARG